MGFAEWTDSVLPRPKSVPPANIDRHSFPDAVASLFSFTSAASLVIVGFSYGLFMALPQPHTGFSGSLSFEDLVTTISAPQAGFEQHHFSPMRISPLPLGAFY